MNTELNEVQKLELGAEVIEIIEASATVEELEFEHYADDLEYIYIHFSSVSS